jgi:hypothetical protein
LPQPWQLVQSWSPWPSRACLPGGLAHADDLDVEVQRGAGQRVVSVHGDRVLVGGHNRQHARPVRAVGAEVHADLDVALGELVARELLHQLLLAQAVPALGADGDLDVIAFRLAQQRLFQAGHDHARPVHVGKRLAVSGPSEESSTVPLVSVNV